MKKTLTLFSVTLITATFFNLSQSNAGYTSDGKTVDCYISVGSGQYPNEASATSEFQIKSSYSKAAPSSKAIRVVLTENQDSQGLSASQKAIMSKVAGPKFTVKLSYLYPTMKLSLRLPNGEVLNTTAKRDITTGAYHNNSSSEQTADIDFSNAKLFSSEKVSASLSCQ